MLGNIIWICPLAPRTSADVLIWDGYEPSRTRGDFFDFEVGGHDGAYKGRIHVIGGALSAVRASATIWVSGRTRDPYFEILGAPRGIMVTPSVRFDF